MINKNGQYKFLKRDPRYTVLRFSEEESGSGTFVTRVFFESIPKSATFLLLRSVTEILQYSTP